MSTGSNESLQKKLSDIIRRTRRQSDSLIKLLQQIKDQQEAGKKNNDE